MNISVTENLKEVLKEAKDQFISISISNQPGKWSDQYFAITEIKEIKRAEENITLMVLSSVEDSHCVTIDINLISGIKFNKYLNFNGLLTSEVEIISKKDLLQLSH